MTLHPDVIEAAGAPEDDGMLGSISAAARARRVLLAQAQPEAITADAVFAAQNELMKRGKLIPASELRAALSAMLTYIAKEGSDDARDRIAERMATRGRAQGCKQIGAANDQQG